MSTTTRYQAARIISIAGIPAALWMLGKIQGSALNGDSASAKRWFAFLIALVLVEIPIALTFYYTRSALKHKNPDAIAVETLAKLQDTERKQ